MTPVTHHPFAYDLGPLQITGFGLGMLLAFVIGQMVSTEELDHRGQESGIMADVTVGAVIGGLLGAKLYYAILTGDPGAILSRAGFVFWGGLIGGILASVIVIKFKQRSFAEISDATAPALAAAYAVGRPLREGDGEGPIPRANLVQQFGLQGYADLPPSQVLAVHPTQLYETAMGLVMFAILWRLRDHKHAAGWLFGAYCVLQGIERFLVEFLRAKDDRFLGPLTVAQVIALGFVACGATWMAMRTRKA